jgi:hypothetical protein
VFFIDSGEPYQRLVKRLRFSQSDGGRAFCGWNEFEQLVIGFIMKEIKIKIEVADHLELLILNESDARIDAVLVTYDGGFSSSSDSDTSAND